MVLTRQQRICLSRGPSKVDGLALLPVLHQSTDVTVALRRLTVRELDTPRTELVSSSLDTRIRQRFPLSVPGGSRARLTVSMSVSVCS